MRSGVDRYSVLHAGRDQAGKLNKPDPEKTYHAAIRSLCFAILTVCLDALGTHRVHGWFCFGGAFYLFFRALLFCI